MDPPTGSSPCSTPRDDAGGRRAGRSTNAGVPSLRADGGRRAARWPAATELVAGDGPDPGRLRQGQQRRRRPGRRSPAARAGLRGRGAAALAGERALPGRRREPRALRRRGQRASPRASWARRLAGSGAIVDAIFGTGFERRAARPGGEAAIEAINAPRRPGGRRRHRLRGRRLRRARSRAPRSRPTLTVTFHAAKLGHWVAPGQAPHRASSSSPPIGIPTGAPGERRAGLIGRRRARAAAAPRRRSRPSSAPGRCSSPAARGGSPAPSAWRRAAATRAGAGYATVAVPARARADLRGQADRGDVVGCSRTSTAASAPPRPSRSSRRPSAPRPSSSGPGSAGPSDAPEPRPRAGRRGSRRRW